MDFRTLQISKRTIDSTARSRGSMNYNSMPHTGSIFMPWHFTATWIYEWNQLATWTVWRSYPKSPVMAPVKTSRNWLYSIMLHFSFLLIPIWDCSLCNEVFWNDQLRFLAHTSSPTAPLLIHLLNCLVVLLVVSNLQTEQCISIVNEILAKLHVDIRQYSIPCIPHTCSLLRCVGVLSAYRSTQGPLHISVGYFTCRSDEILGTQAATLCAQTS